ncbi:MAG: hypothetical protein ABI627_20250 [Polyangiaceae bacterium]
MVLSAGNLLGNPRAEADRLLDRAFVETADFRALVETEDFHIVVGRRGTGKSALYHRVRDHFRANPKVCLHAETPSEHAALALQAVLDARGCNYRSGRALSRVLWRAYILTVLARNLLSHSKMRDPVIRKELEACLEMVVGASDRATAYDYFSAVFALHDGVQATALPGAVATTVGIDSLESVVRAALGELKGTGVVLFDSLDEGWQPTELPTALLGGLAMAAADLAERGMSVYVLAFVRDNMFRALAYFDPDFSARIEGIDLRLRWDENSLLHFVAQRLRVALSLDVESDIKIWGRFAQRGLEGRTGFELCLKQTLYRPRDVLVLLNKAYTIAAKAGRTHIFDDDIATAARMISTDRLEDLFKEYNQVFPGLRLFVEVFRGSKPVWLYQEIMSCLRAALDREGYSDANSGDFAILETPREIFVALNSVGFFGVQRDQGTGYVFCHDGATSELGDTLGSASVAIHPCYWRALDLSDPSSHVEILTAVFDEYAPARRSNELRDVRTQRLGQVVEELPRLEEGDEHASAFEDWVLRAIKILFAGHLSNVAIHPNGDAVQRRDVVATNLSQGGFWRRVFEDYRARQVVFEVKNYSSLGIEDIRQCLSYSGKEYGSLIFIVYRTENEGVDERERAWLQEMYSQHGLIVFLLPAKFLARFLSKYRNRKRIDYWDDAMNKRLDTHLRSYLHVKAGRRPRRAKARVAS